MAIAAKRLIIAIMYLGTVRSVPGLDSSSSNQQASRSTVVGLFKHDTFVTVDFVPETSGTTTVLEGLSVGCVFKLTDVKQAGQTVMRCDELSVYVCISSFESDAQARHAASVSPAQLSTPQQQCHDPPVPCLLFQVHIGDMSFICSFK
jgi:hypothetical protein